MNTEISFTHSAQHPRLVVYHFISVLQYYVHNTICIIKRFVCSHHLFVCSWFQSLCFTVKCVVLGQCYSTNKKITMFCLKLLFQDIPVNYARPPCSYISLGITLSCMVKHLKVLWSVCPNLPYTAVWSVFHIWTKVKGLQKYICIWNILPFYYFSTNEGNHKYLLCVLLFLPLVHVSYI